MSQENNTICKPKIRWRNNLCFFAACLILAEGLEGARLDIFETICYAGILWICGGIAFAILTADIEPKSK